jgi:hypothetical protein
MESVFIALAAWTLLAYVCGLAIGRIIDLLGGGDKFDDPRGC